MNRFRYVARIGSAIITGLIIWCLYPRMVYLFYLGQGGSILNMVADTVPLGKQLPTVCGLHIVINDDQKQKLAGAITSLKKAIAILPSASRAYLLLGRGECLLGDYGNAIQSLNTYHQFRPSDVIGNIESGFAAEGSGNDLAAQDQWKAAKLYYTNFTEVGDALREKQLFEESNIWYERGGLLLGRSLDELNEVDAGETVIESFTSTHNWTAYPNNSQGLFQANIGILTMYYANNLDERDLFSYAASFNKLPISTYRELLIRLRNTPDSSITIEIVIDGIRIRPISYQYLPDSWEILRIPISGNVLTNLTIGISEPTSSPSAENHSAFFDWIALK